jgi:hypothetical protein
VYHVELIEMPCSYSLNDSFYMYHFRCHVFQTGVTLVSVLEVVEVVYSPDMDLVNQIGEYFIYEIENFLQ